MLAEPTLREKPLGIQQKNIVVTCNYVARARGVGKCVSVRDAVAACPELVLVNGEDLARYRRVSAAVHQTLASHTESAVERLGMDENWVDVTRLVERELAVEGTEKAGSGQEIVGEKVGLECEQDYCDCPARLLVGGRVAARLRRLLLDQHGLTVSAGVSYNKVLAKLAGGLHKPDQQTVLGPAGLEAALPGAARAALIPGVGSSTAARLAGAGVETVEQLRAASPALLARAGIGQELGANLVSLASGRDNSVVRQSGRPGSIGLEDRFQGVTTMAGVKEKLSTLLDRLGGLLAEDGRLASTLKITVRDYWKDKLVKKFHKESRQCRIAASLSATEAGALRSGGKAELLAAATGLVGKIVGSTGQQFHLTLLGIAVQDFVQQVENRASIKNFFNAAGKQPVASQKAKETRDKEEDKAETVEQIPNQENLPIDKVHVPETMTGPSKEARQGGLVCPAKYDITVWVQLPRELQEELTNAPALASASPPAPALASACPTTSALAASASPTASVLASTCPSAPALAASACPSAPLASACPSSVDPTVFAELPESIKQELLSQAKHSNSSHKSKPKPKKNSIKNYFIVSPTK